MPSPKERLTAEAVFRDRTPGQGRAPRVNVPVKVQNKLRAKAGDKLVFKEASDAAIDKARTRAAILKEPYFIVWLERGVPAAMPERTAQPSPEAPPPQPVSLEEDVRRRLGARAGGVQAHAAAQANR